MNRKLLSRLALSVALVSVGMTVASAQTTTATPSDKRRIKVAELPNAQSVAEFQRNVQLMLAQRQALVELNKAHEAEKDPAKKKELKAKMDAALAKLNQDNQQMVKSYNYSIDRNYTMEIEKAGIWLEVTEEEAAKLEKQQAEQAKQKSESTKKKK